MGFASTPETALDEGMERQHFFSHELHQSAAPFSHIARVGEVGYVSGIIGQNRADGGLVSSDPTTQCRAMFDNLETLLGEVGLGMEAVVTTRLYLTDYADFAAFNTVYAERLSAPYPARTTIQVAGLPLGAAVQIDAVLAYPQGR